MVKESYRAVSSRIEQRLRGYIMSEIALKIDTPVKTIERYAADTGIPVGQVKKMVQRGELQIMPKQSARHRALINMVAVYQQAAAAAYLPAIS